MPPLNLNHYTILWYDSLPSTNDILKKNHKKFSDYTVVVAKEQSQGRGRFERQWRSSSGKDLTFSLLLPLTGLDPSLWPNIPQLAVLSVSDALRAYQIENYIKWPNDLLIKGKKVCGVLCETVSQTNTYAILGVGININSTQEDLSLLDRPATSLSCELGFCMKLEKVLTDFLNIFSSFFKDFLSSGFAPFHSIINKRLAYKGEMRTIVEGERKTEGTVLGINGDGTLQFKTAAGEMRQLYCGEISFHEGNRGVE